MKVRTRILSAEAYDRRNAVLMLLPHLLDYWSDRRDSIGKRWTTKDVVDEAHFIVDMVDDSMAEWEEGRGVSS